MNVEKLDYLISAAALPEDAACILKTAANDVPVEIENIIAIALQEYRKNTLFPFEDYRQQLEQFQNTHLWQMLYCFVLAGHLHSLYLESGRGEWMFSQLMKDFGAKARECYDYTGAWGIRSAKWYNRWFTMERIALKRLQFEVREFADTYQHLTPKDLAINVHIPALGPLDATLCEEDYLQAAEFFGEHFGESIPFMTHTWLLNPDHPKFLPPTSRLLTFQAKYEIFKFHRHSEFLWRLYGVEYNGDPYSLTERNSLERAYRKRMIEGGPVGEGKGVFFLPNPKKV